MNIAMWHTRSPQRIPNKVQLLFYLVVAVLLLIGAAHAGEVYKWTDSAGKVHFGDKPLGGIQATRLDIPTSPETPTASPQSVVTTHDGGYSDTLNTCLAAGGTNTDCVAKASAAQTDKDATERRMREIADHNRAAATSYPPSFLTHQPTSSTDSDTAQRAAALAAERARQRREQIDQDRRWR